MEKLIELLNQFEWDTKYPTWSLSWANEPLYWGWTAYASSYLIPSKEYWFIKWLVDNDKIRTIEHEDEMCPVRIYRGHMINYYDDEEVLLMLLSIQDNPIEFLVSILK